MERHGHAGVARFFCADLTQGEIRLEGAPAQHARARRVQSGDAVQLIDGRGNAASGRVASLGKDHLVVTVGRVAATPRPTLLDVLVPVADRDRMLLAAEKCAELQVSAWRPVYFARSRSVSPRGEGEKFREKVRARMQGALEQSGSCWMPDIHDESDLRDVLALIPDTSQRFVLDPSGEPLASLLDRRAIAIAIGPEGGLEPEELASFQRSGWLPATLGPTILRFETAVIAGVAVARSGQLSSRSALRDQ